MCEQNLSLLITSVTDITVNIHAHPYHIIAIPVLRNKHLIMIIACIKQRELIVITFGTINYYYFDYIIIIGIKAYQ